MYNIPLFTNTVQYITTDTTL